MIVARMSDWCADADAGPSTSGASAKPRGKAATAGSAKGVSGSGASGADKSGALGKPGGRLQAKKAGTGSASAMDVDGSLLDDVDTKEGLEVKLEGSSSDTEEDAPFLQEDAYYPTLLPFQRVEEAHDSEALSRHVIPTDLAEREVWCLASACLLHVRADRPPCKLRLFTPGP